MGAGAACHTGVRRPGREAPRTTRAMLIQPVIQTPPVARIGGGVNQSAGGLPSGKGPEAAAVLRA